MNDGTVSFMGGMDASRQPFLLENERYSRGCNVLFNRETGLLGSRFGMECVRLVGDPDAICIYNNAKNVQAEGYYKGSDSVYLLRLVDGWLIQIELLNEKLGKVSLLNLDDRRNPNLSKAWITTVPRGAIVNDGQGLPHIVRQDGIRRSKPENSEIGVGKMGVYVQNRFFYVDATGKFIWASDFRNPESLSNAKNTNIWGFMVPDDSETITAIGIRKQTLNYVEGGTLSFSTINNTYSVDVRGDRQNWEEMESNTGKVQESLPGIGAASSYSYEAFASNLYFRSLDGGMIDLYGAKEQFGSGSAYSGQSSEILCWLERDTKRLLQKCYTRKFADRLLTTVGPLINEHGFCYWSGLVSMLPEPVYQGQRLPNIHEGLWTGVRPWCLTSFRDSANGDQLFIDSYDGDCKTRLYRLNVKLDSDVREDGSSSEIKSWLETKGYTFGELAKTKRMESRSYSLLNLPRDLEVRVETRVDTAGQWQLVAKHSHYVPRASAHRNQLNVRSFRPTGSKSQSRIVYNLPKEPDSASPASTIAGGDFYFRQYRLNFTGAFQLSTFMLRAREEDSSNSPSRPEEEKDKKILAYNKEPDYNYLIQQ